MQLHKQEERICRELGNKDGLWRSLYNQATLLCKRNDPRIALPKIEEAIRLLQETGIEPEFLVHAKTLLNRLREKLGG